jgi:5-methylcytosine-specific restriction endonuclease McrA
MAISISFRRSRQNLPARAFRPYAVDQVAQRQQFDTSRIDDPIRKLYQTKLWRTVRRVVLARDPFCSLCPEIPDSPAQALSTVVHHVIAARKHIAQHGGDVSYFYDESNLQGACKPCHDALTARECGFTPRAANRG